MTKSDEKWITWGLLALIAYELWTSKGTPLQVSTPSLSGNIDQAPPWVQQLSAVEHQLYLTDYNNLQISNEITDNLLSLPQGPGGSYLAPVTNNYFTPLPGAFCGSSQMIAPQVLSQA